MPFSVKNAILKAASYSGVFSIARKLKAGPIVLFYHGVEETLVDRNVQKLHVSLGTFEKQITYLRKHFEIISLDDLYDGLSGGVKMRASQVVLTFDDGYKNNRKVVLPYLAQYDVPFAVFVSTRHVTEGLRFPTYYLRAGIYYSKERQARILEERFDISSQAGKDAALSAISRKLKSSPQDVADGIIKDLVNLLPQDQWAELNHVFCSDEPMDWAEVRQLHDSGVAIGSHCHDHFILHKSQSINNVGRQLRTSKAQIQEHVGRCDYFAYPNGKVDDISPAAVACVEENRYLAGFTTISGEVVTGRNPFILPRIAAPVSDDMSQFVFLLSSSFRKNRAFERAAVRLSSTSGQYL